jgi:hypothetical protein
LVKWRRLCASIDPSALPGTEEKLMKSERVWSFDPIGPDELKMIERIFRSELQLRALPLKSEEAQVLAAKLIDAYQSGIRDTTGLAAAAKRC